LRIVFARLKAVAEPAENEQEKMRLHLFLAQSDADRNRFVDVLTTPARVGLCVA